MPGFLHWLFSLPTRHPELRLDLLGELLLAALLGGAIGWERERAHKPAGLRTNILICIGAALLADLSDPRRRQGGAAGRPRDALPRRSCRASASSGPARSSRPVEA